MLIKKELKGFFSESLIIPENRGITLHSPCLNNGQNTYLHFIYGPPNFREAETFWEKTRKNISKKVKPGNTHYIIGDLNIHMNKELDTNSGSNQRKPKAFKDLYNELGLIDTYRKYNKRRKGYTFFRVEEEGNLVKSRVDYVLAPQESQDWQSPVIYNNTMKISKDHRPIGITINMTMKRRGAKRIEGIKIKRMKIKNIEEETKQKIKEETTISMDKEWDLWLKKDDMTINLEEIYQKYQNLIWEVAEKTLTVTEKKNNNYMETPKRDTKLEEIEKQYGYMVKALLTIPLSVQRGKLNKSIIKINKLKEEYGYIYELDENYMNIDPHLEKLRKHLKDKLKIIRKDIEGIKKKLTGEFIQKRVNEIQLNRVDNPGKFFARAQPDSVFRSQQVWTVEYEETERIDNSEKKIKVSSSVPEIVKREVKNAWEKIFTTKKQKNKNTNEAFLTRKFIKRREKILNKDQKLIKEITEEEVKETINQLSNGTACGPDNIPNEIIKYMSKSNQFLKLITKILNICIKQKKIPEMWKKSNIYTIYKKENPNNPLTLSFF